MKAFAWFVCYPCRWCCPCAETATNKTKVSGKTAKTAKTGNKTDRSPKTATKSLKLPKSPPKTERKTAKNLVKGTKTKPKTIKDFKHKSLTKEYRIPEDFTSRDEFFKTKGITLGEEIGNGTYGTVYKITDNMTGTVMACKTIKLFREDLNQFENLKTELFIMINAKPNQHIIRVLEHFILSDTDNSTDFCYIIMELANGGSILDRMKTIGENNEPIYKRLDEKKAKDYFKQTVDGLDYLHSVLETAHKDLKLLNILVCIQSDNSEVIKITDFGLSRISYDQKIGVIKNKTWVGTVDYMSPQIYRIWVYDKYGIKLEKLKEYNPFAADCWALGVCLYVMITASNPFNTGVITDPQIQEVYQNMKQQKYEISQNTRFVYSNDCLELIKALLEPKVDTRLSVKHVLTHPWLKR